MVREDGSADVSLPWSHRLLAAKQGFQVWKGRAHLICDASSRRGTPDHLALDVQYRSYTNV